MAGETTKEADVTAATATGAGIGGEYAAIKSAIDELIRRGFADV